MTDTDVAEAFERTAAAVTSVPISPARLRRRARWRRRLRAGGVLSVGGAVVVSGAVLAGAGPPDASPAEPSERMSVVPSPSAVQGATAPDLVGLTSQDAEARLRAAGYEWWAVLWVASDDVIADHVISQEPPPGARSGDLTLVYSAGVPVPVSEVPVEAQQLLRGRMAPGEQVLVVPTDSGTAYKVDAVLVGPCAAVDLAYRTFLDPRYDSECY